ncbi:hypothetical protein GCM10027052_13110 [Parafrigoribacterium mesophilum]
MPRPGTFKASDPANPAMMRVTPPRYPAPRAPVRPAGIRPRRHPAPDIRPPPEIRSGGSRFTEFL